MGSPCANESCVYFKPCPWVAILPVGVHSHYNERDKRNPLVSTTNQDTVIIIAGYEHFRSGRDQIRYSGSTSKLKTKSKKSNIGKSNRTFLATSCSSDLRPAAVRVWMSIVCRPRGTAVHPRPARAGIKVGCRMTLYRAVRTVIHGLRIAIGTLVDHRYRYIHLAAI